MQPQVDLTSYTFAPLDTLSSQYISVEFAAIVPASGTSQYTISASDSLGIQIDLSDVTFESVTGQVKPTSITVDPIEEEIDIPEGLDRAQLTQAELNINLITTAP